jgi:hypothetical protein
MSYGDENRSKHP